MRVLKALLVLAVVVSAVLAGRPAQASTADLVAHLDELASSFVGGVGLWIADPNAATPLYTRNPDEHVVTHRAIGTYFTMLAKKQLISAAASERMLARLERQQINNRLPADLPDGVVIAHKTGNLVGVVHDAGIIFTPFGPRVVVAMTWDAYDEEADAFIANIGSIVYSAVLEPPANARYSVPRAPAAADIDSRTRVTVTVTNVGTNTWAATGPQSVGLIW